MFSLSRMISLAALACVSVVAFTGCALMDPGPATTKHHTFDDVTGVELETDGDLTVSIGETIALSVTAGEDVIDHLTFTVNDGTLHLGVEGQPLAYGGEIRYELTVPVLDSISVRGSGDAVADFSATVAPVVSVQGSGSVTATGIYTKATASVTVDGSGSIDAGELDIQDLTARIDGAGEITASGSALTQTVEIRGSGDYFAAELQSSDAEIAIRGSGNASVAVAGTLNAVIDGSGTIHHTGDPLVTKEISGSGELIKK